MPVSVESRHVLSTVAERIGDTWARLGATVVCYEPGQESPAMPKLADALVRCVTGVAPVSFKVVGGGKGLAVPITCFDRCLGSIGCVLPERFNGQADALLAIFEDQVLRSQQLAQHESELTSLSEELAKVYEELSLIYKLGKRLNLAEIPHVYLERYSSDLLDVVGARTLIMFVQPPDSDTSIVHFAGEPLVSEVRLEAAARYLRELMSERAEPILLTELCEHRTLVELLEPSDHTVLALPLKTAEHVLGVIAAIDKTDGEVFDSVDAKLLDAVAEQTAGFLENRFLVQDLNGLLTAVLTSLVNAIDAKDPYTSGHSQRVALLSWHIADAIGLTEQETTDIYLAGLLHDVGKIGIEESVLTKPGKLTREEYDTVKQHPVIGARIISGIKQLRGVIPGLLYHHERYDGSGYPEGLRGEQIPLMGSVVALADYFDAITSDRTYRHAISYDQALVQATDPSSQAFSPAVIRALSHCPLKQLECQLRSEGTVRRPPGEGPVINWARDP